MTSHEFLLAELGHAERHLARTRRLQAKMHAGLEAAGLDELAVYEKLAAHKAYRQLQRDELFYQQMWLRLNRHLERYAAPATPAPAPQPAAATPPSPRKPGPNEKCPCHSGHKYKKCCGRPAGTPLPGEFERQAA